MTEPEAPEGLSSLQPQSSAPAIPSPAGGLERALELLDKWLDMKSDPGIGAELVLEAREALYWSVNAAPPDQSERVAELESQLEHERGQSALRDHRIAELDSLRKTLTECESEAVQFAGERDEARRELAAQRKRMVEQKLHTCAVAGTPCEPCAGCQMWQDLVNARSELSAAQERLAAWAETGVHGFALASLVTQFEDPESNINSIAERYLAALPKPSPAQGEHVSCARCNGSGVTGPELMSCGDCLGCGEQAAAPEQPYLGAPCERGRTGNERPCFTDRTLASGAPTPPPMCGPCSKLWFALRPAVQGAPDVERALKLASDYLIIAKICATLDAGPARDALLGIIEALGGMPS